MKIYTIGYTKKTAEEFFKLLRVNRVNQIIDIRLNNTSQLAGFTKKRDFIYFLKELADIDYLEIKMLAPTREILKEYRSTKNWQNFEESFTELLKERDIEANLDRGLFKDRFCLLCSEVNPEHCHRSIVARYLKDIWTDKDVEIIHL